MKSNFGWEVTTLIFILLIHAIKSEGQNHKQIPSEKPKLIVTLVIDQFRYDYIYKFWDKFEENGIRKLVQEGTFCKNAEYNYSILHPKYTTPQQQSYWRSKVYFLKQTIKNLGIKIKED